MKIELEVQGMHCQSCEMLIKESLEELGVLNVQPNQKHGLVWVDFDEATVNLNQIKSAIGNLGFSIIELR